ncbi:hypothetical protein N8005_07810 [Litorivicinus sp.]|nr:hypothetical protein [Litorivicinus sp.]
MKKSLLAHFFLLVLLVSPMSFGADFSKGVIAYGNGDFATALRELRPLAEQGNAPAQYNLGAICDHMQMVHCLIPIRIDTRWDRFVDYVQHVLEFR